MSDEPTVFVQWKGTDVCLDFRCSCGHGGHFDGDFAYHLRCSQCRRVYGMPHTFTLVEVVDGDWTSAQEPEPWMQHPRREGSDVVEVHASEPE